MKLNIYTPDETKFMWVCGGIREVCAYAESTGAKHKFVKDVEGYWWQSEHDDWTLTERSNPEIEKIIITMIDLIKTKKRFGMLKYMEDL